MGFEVEHLDERRADDGLGDVGRDLAEEGEALPVRERIGQESGHAERVLCIGNWLVIGDGTHDVNVE